MNNGPSNDFELVSRFWREVVNERNLDVLADVVSPDFVLHFPATSPADSLTGIPALRDYLEKIGNGLPDARATIEEQFSPGEGTVLSLLTFAVPRATVNEAGEEEMVEHRFRGVTISRILAGLIVETQLYWEALRAEAEIEQHGTPWIWRWPPWVWP